MNDSVIEVLFHEASPPLSWIVKIAVSVSFKFHGSVWDIVIVGFLRVRLALTFSAFPCRKDSMLANVASSIMSWWTPLYVPLMNISVNEVSMSEMYVPVSTICLLNKNIARNPAM